MALLEIWARPADYYRDMVKVVFGRYMFGPIKIATISTNLEKVKYDNIVKWARPISVEAIRHPSTNIAFNRGFSWLVNGISRHLDIRYNSIPSFWLACDEVWMECSLWLPGTQYVIFPIMHLDASAWRHTFLND